MAHEKGDTEHEDPLTIYGIDRLDEEKLRAAEKKAREAFKHAKIFTKEKVAAEKRVNALAVAAKRAHRVRTSKLGKGDPAKLWSTPIKDRHVDYLGAIIQIGMGVPSDAINAIASGAKPGPGMVEGEMRKSILGALVALKEAHASDVSTKGLKAPIKAGKEVDAALAKACGLPGKELEQVYTAMVKRIAKYGPAMRALAWSYRAQLWLKDVANIEKVHALSGAIVSVFVPIGTAVGAAIGGHSAITLAVARVLSLKAEAMIRKVLPEARAEAGAPAGGTERGGRPGAEAGPGGGHTMLWVLGGLGLLGVGTALFLQDDA